MKALQIILFLILLIFILLNCSSTSNQSQNILNVALFDNPTNLDPRTSSDVASYRIIEQIYDPLLKLDSTGTAQPVLAEKWWTERDTVYYFQLRKNIFFHDGTRLTAADAAYTFKTVLDPALKAPARKSFDVIEKISVPDSFLLKIKLKHVFSPFLANMEMGIVPKHLLVKQPEILRKHPLGSGPFKFVKWVPDLYLKLQANQNYWSGAPHIDGLMIKILPEATTRILALEYGDVDFLMNNFPLSYLDRFRQNNRLKVRMMPGSNYVYLGLNLRNKYLQHKKVRQALTCAIDVDKIIKTLMGGIYQRAHSLLNPMNWAFNPDLKSYPFDPSKAKELLDEAHFPDPDDDGPQFRFSLNYKCTDKQMSRQKAQIIQHYLQNVGIQVKIQSYEWGTFFDDIQHGRFEVYSLTWVGINEPDFYDRIFHSRSIRSGANRGGYVNPEADRLIEEAQKSLDFGVRRKKYYRLQEILNEELPYISLWYETNIAVMNKNLFGFRFYPAAEWRSFRRVYFK